MSQRLRTVGAVVVAVVVSVVLATGCTRGDDVDPASRSVPTTADEQTRGDAATPTAQPLAPQPGVGDCRELVFADTVGALTDAAAQPVACGVGHTAQTFATGMLAAATDLDPARDPDGVAEAVSQDCRAALVGWLGGDEAAYELSMFAYVVAVPPAEDRAAGVDWYRCDTYAAIRPGELAPLPPSTKGALVDADVDRWASCVDGELSVDPNQVLCSEPHDWRGVSAHRLGDRADEFPGERAAAEQARTWCRADVAAWVGDPLASFQYGWLRPTSADWRAGQRFVLCFARTPT